MEFSCKHTSEARILSLLRGSDHVCADTQGSQTHPGLISDRCSAAPPSRCFLQPPQNYQSRYSGAAMARLLICFRQLLPPEPGRKAARAPRPPHRMRWRPCAPTRVPRPYWQLPISRNRPCVPWSQCMAHQ